MLAKEIRRIFLSRVHLRAWLRSSRRLTGGKGVLLYGALILPDLLMAREPYSLYPRDTSSTS